MRAIRIHGPKDIRLDEVALRPLALGEVRVRVRATGFCGTDVEIQDGTMAYFTRGMATYPVIPGHEWVGEVAEIGPGVSGFDIGDRVVGECSVGCMRCAICKAGRYHQCGTRTETGILNRDGGFAEYIAFPALFLHRIAAHVEIRAAALVEPTAIAFNGVKAGGVTPEDHVVIHGDGPIGLLILQCVKAFGARRVTMVGATPARLALAGDLGADQVINARAEEVTTALSPASRADVSIEATGIPEAAAVAIATTRPGGRVVLQGLFGGRLLTGFDLDQIVINDLTVRGALGSPNIWPEVIALIESGRVDPLRIVTHSVGLQDFAKGIDLITSRRGVKIVALQE